MTKTARIEALTAALTAAADEMIAQPKSELARLWTELCEANISISTAKRDLAVALPLAIEARKAAAEGKKAVKEAARRAAIVTYLTDNADTIKGIAANLGIHHRTVRAAILYGKGELGFRCVGVTDTRAKLWQTAA